MTYFIVDWQRPGEYVPTETEENRFKLNPLPVCTKDRFSLETEARIILEIDDNSIIIKNFGSLIAFIEDKLTPLVREFFTCKERVEIISKRQSIQKELVEMLQKELIRYGVKISSFMMISMLPYEPRVKNDKNDKKDLVKESIKEESIKEIFHPGDLSDLRLDMFPILLERLLLLLALATVALVLTMLSAYYDNKIYPILGALISITVIVMGIYQYLEIKKIRKTIRPKKCKTRP